VYDAFAEAARPGATEQALDAAVLKAANGHETSYDLITGPRTAGIEGIATERVLQAGDPLLLDLCLKVGDHWCDVCRTFFLGEPTPEMAQTYGKVLRCFTLVENLLRVDTPAGSLYRAAESYFAQNGMAGWMRHHAGHGIGLAPMQAPVAVADSADVLSVGDVVTVEIGVYTDGYGIRVEDDYLITPQGAKALWAYPKSLESMILKYEG